VAGQLTERDIAFIAQMRDAYQPDLKALARVVANAQRITGATATGLAPFVETATRFQQGPLSIPKVVPGPSSDG
jgi:hypothetical protein